jgi:hypothetical protein
MDDERDGKAIKHNASKNESKPIRVLTRDHTQDAVSITNQQD